MLELLLAVAMMMVFTGVVAVVMEFTLRFMREAECPLDVCNDGTTQDVANGAVIDRQQIEVLFDQLEPFLVQPGIHHSQIARISTPLGKPPNESNCTLTSSTSTWSTRIQGLPNLVFPRGYHICLWRMGEEESDMEKLVAGSATPSLYFLQALPIELNASTLPVRRLICRPRPFAEPMTTTPLVGNSFFGLDISQLAHS